MFCPVSQLQNDLKPWRRSVVRVVLLMHHLAVLILCVLAICSRSVALMSRLLSLRTLLRPSLHCQLHRGHAPLCSALLGRSACSLLVHRSSKNDWLRAPQCTAKRRSSSAVAGSRQPMSESTRQMLRG
jgi:hypothetical protein